MRAEQEAVGILVNTAANLRMDLFRGFIPQIEEASKGAWTAVEVAGVNGTLFLGQAGRALVFSPTGQMFVGQYTPQAFQMLASSLVQITYAALKEIK